MSTGSNKDIPSLLAVAKPRAIVLSDGRFMRAIAGDANEGGMVSCFLHLCVRC